MTFPDFVSPFWILASGTLTILALFVWLMAAKRTNRRRAGALLMRPIPFEVITDIYGRVRYGHFELRQHGIVAEAFYPWKTLKRYEWMGERPTRLKIVANDATRVFPLRYLSDRKEVDQILASRTGCSE